MLLWRTFGSLEALFMIVSLKYPWRDSNPHAMKARLLRPVDKPILLQGQIRLFTTQGEIRTHNHIFLKDAAYAISLPGLLFIFKTEIIHIQKSLYFLLHDLAHEYEKRQILFVLHTSNRTNSIQ